MVSWLHRWLRLSHKDKPPNTAWSRLVQRAAANWWRACVSILIARHLFERLTQTVGRLIHKEKICCSMLYVLLAAKNYKSLLICPTVSRPKLERNVIAARYLF